MIVIPLITSALTIIVLYLLQKQNKILGGIL